jgi:uncharacterized protein YceH (UPF0502 family)
MNEPSSNESPVWKVLTPRQRRVLGTLMEKAKTTPDTYPMTMLSLLAGCNQKNNRSPVSHYTQEQIEETVEQLQQMGAVSTIHGHGRVAKIRHNGHQWLGVQRVDAAIMTELLLRGEQTLGDLRARASRLEPIADLKELQDHVAALHLRGLLVYLTPPGRGQIVSHQLYLDEELAALRRSVAEGQSQTADADQSISSSTSTTDNAAQNPKEPKLQELVQRLHEAVAGLDARIRRIEEALELPPIDNT